MLVNFTKMHSLGNDFVLIDAITQNIKLHSAYIKKLANRNIGIGCDQFIILEPPLSPDTDFYYKIYNANGKLAEQCLNGARCAARFAIDIGLVNKKVIIAECTAGRIILTMENNHIVSGNLGSLNPQIFNNTINGVEVYHLAIGNPHAIVILPNEISKQYPDLEDDEYKYLAESIAGQKNFVNGVNIGIARLVDANNIRLRVFERGTGETLACGSNAIALFLVAKYLNLINNKAKILFKFGVLHVKVENNCLVVKGPTNSVFIGKFKI